MLPVSIRNCWNSEHNCFDVVLWGCHGSDSILNGTLLALGHRGHILEQIQENIKEINIQREKLNLPQFKLINLYGPRFVQSSV